MSAENETTTEVQSTSPLASLGINPTLFVFQLINFAIVATIIWYLILKPLTKKMTERAKLIDESLDNAKKFRKIYKKANKNIRKKSMPRKLMPEKLLRRPAKKPVR